MDSRPNSPIREDATAKRLTVSKSTANATMLEWNAHIYASVKTVWMGDRMHTRAESQNGLSKQWPLHTKKSLQKFIFLIFR